MPFQFKSEEVHCIMKACENHTFSGPKPACLANLTQRLTLSAKEFRDLVRYLKSVATTPCERWISAIRSKWQAFLVANFVILPGSGRPLFAPLGTAPAKGMTYGLAVFIFRRFN